MTRGGRSRAPALAALGIAGALAGGCAAPWLAAHLGPPVRPDPADWTVIVPTTSESAGDVARGAGTGLVDGALTVAVRAFGRADVLVPVAATPVAAVELEFAPDSAPVYLSVHEPSGHIARVAELGPDGWRGRLDLPWRAYPYAGPVRVELAGPFARVDGFVAGQGVSGTIELGALSGDVRLLAVRTEDASGAPITDARFGYPTPDLRVRLACAAGGAALAMAAGLAIASGWVGAALVALVAAAAWRSATTPYAAWHALAEQLRLVQTPPSHLRMLAFGAVWLPVLAAAVTSSGVLTLAGRARRGTVPAGVVLGAVAVAALAARGLPGAWALMAVPGVGFLLMPWRAVRAGVLPARGVLLRELPAWAVLAALGWGAGLLPVVLWRLLCLYADVPTLLARAPRIGADGVFLALALAPVGVESAVRASSAGPAWAPEVLAGASVGPDPSAGLAPFWSGRCGGAPRAIYTFGGSSAGGAYQFLDEPEAFFPARLHARLCAAGVDVIGLDYADGGRDSFDAAAAAPTLFAAQPPAVVIAYLGVNDLLTVESPLTRKQQAEARAAYGTAVAGLDRLASSIRTLAGLSLLLRPPADAAALVAAVPLPDAEANLRSLCAAATGAGGAVLLVPEHVQTAVVPRMEDYRAMERKLADELPGVAYVDLPAALGDAGDSLLADRNHLTREGSVRVAEVLQPAVVAALAAPPP